MLLLSICLISGSFVIPAEANAGKATESNASAEQADPATYLKAPDSVPDETDEDIINSQIESKESEPGGQVPAKLSRSAKRLPKLATQGADIEEGEEKNLSDADDTGDDGNTGEDPSGDDEAIVSGTCGESVEWVLDRESGILDIYGEGTMDSYTVSPWADYSADIRILSVSDGVTSLGAYAFEGLTELTEAALPDSITSIGFRAFADCTSLASINIPLGWNDCPTSKSGTSTSEYCGRIFINCQALTSITVPEGMTELPSYAFNGSNYLESISLPDSLTSIKNHAFYNCTKLTSVIVPDGVTSLGKSAFCGDSALVDVTLPEGLTDIALYAFCGCTSLESIELPDSVKNIGYQAFEGCTKLSQINIPLSWEKCPTSANDGTTTSEYCGQIFKNCKALTEITVPEGITELPSYAFNASNYLVKVTLPDSLTNIKNHTFYNCTKLTSVTVPDGVTELGKSAFCYCSALTEVSLPDGLKNISLYAFCGCRSLVSIRLPDSVEKIGYQAFEGCTKLSQINIPLSWKECPSSANDGTLSTEYCGQIFKNCNALTEITVPEGITELPSYALNGSNYLVSVTLPEGYERLKNHTFFNCTRLKSIEIPDSVTYMGKSVLCGCSALTDVKLPSELTELPLFAFCGCTSLESIELPDSIEKIGYQAFEGCTKLSQVNIPLSWNECPSADKDGNLSTDDCGQIFKNCKVLTEITVPDGITELPTYAFNGCGNVVEVTLPESLTDIGGFAFYGCSSLEHVSYPESVNSIGESAFCNCSSLISASVPEGVETIAPYTFAGCSKMIAVSLPKTVTSVQESAFSNCSELTKICYAGENDDWDAISVIDSGNDSFIQLRESYDKGFDPPLDEDDLMGVWEGEYDGSSGDVIVRRHFVFIINDVYKAHKDEVRITGTRTISQSLENPTEYYADGSDSVSGTIDLNTGAIHFQGTSWIEKPVGPSTSESSEFYHAEYVGCLGSDRDSMTGSIYHGSTGNLNGDFHAHRIIMPEGSDTSVVLSMNNKHYDLFKESATVEEGSDTTGTIVVKPDWGDEEPGTIRIFQRSIEMKNTTGVFIDKKLGQTFLPGKTIYVSLIVKKDGKSKTIGTWPLKLKIRSKEQIAGYTTTDYRRYKSKELYLQQPHISSKTYAEGVKSLISGNTTDSSSPPIPGLENTYTGMNINSFVPQGFCKFRYNNKKYYLISAYDKNEKYNSVIYVLDQNFRFIKNITLPNKFHNGGITYDPDGDMLWFCGNTSIPLINNVSCYQGAKLGKLITSTDRICNINSFDQLWTINNKPSCLDYHAGRLWVGTCNTDKNGVGKIIGYKTNGGQLDSGNTVSIEGVKKCLNGFTFGDDHDIYISYSSGRYSGSFARIEHYSLGLGTLIGGASVPLNHIRTRNVPKMNEEIILDGNTLYVLYESAATAYIDDVYIITDRVTGIDKSAWIEGKETKNALRSASRGAESITLTEGEAVPVDFGYDAAAESDTTETTVMFTPEASGSYKLSVTDLDHQGTYAVTGVVTDDEETMCGVVSTLTTEETDEGIERVYHAGGDVEINLTGGKTYIINMTVTAQSDEEAFSGSYQLSVSRTGGIVSVAAAEGETSRQEVTVGSAACFEFVPPETAKYLITWGADGELSDCEAKDDNGITVGIDDGYCDLEAGKTYYFTAVLDEAAGVAGSAAVTFCASIVREQEIVSGTEITITTDTALAYHAETGSRMTVESSDKSEGITISVYNSSGSLTALGGSKAVFTAEQGADYRIIFTGIRKSTRITVTPYIVDIADLKTSMNTEFVYSPSLALPVPAVTEDQYTLVKDTDYRIAYSADSRSVGVHTVTITGVGNYKGTKKISYTVRPIGTTISKAKAGKKSCNVTWKKQAAKMATSQINGYEIRYSLYSNMTKAKTKTVKGIKKTSLKVKKLKAKKKYYFQIRTFKTVNGKKYYSDWSKAKTVKIKK